MGSADMRPDERNPKAANSPALVKKESGPTRRQTSEHHGEVAEWTKAPVSTETGPREGTEGSNPSFTAERESNRALLNLNNDRVVPRRWVGRRLANRPTSPAPQPRRAAVGRWSGALCREAEAPDS